MIGGREVEVILDFPDWLFLYFDEMYALHITMTDDEDLTYEDYVASAIISMVTDIDPESVKIGMSRT